MPHPATFLNEAQRSVLRWVSDGTPDGVYEGATHRVTVRALHNRGLVEVTGRGDSWQATITRQGEAWLAEEDARLEAEAEKARLEADTRLKQERARQEYLDRCAELVERVIANGGRLDVGRELDAYGVARMRNELRGSGSVPSGRRLACEPTKMDPSLGLTVYLEPDFDQLVVPRPIDVPESIATADRSIQRFMRKRAWVTKEQIPRAARIMLALLTAVRAAGWKIDDNAPRGHGERNPDVVLKLPFGSATATIYELDFLDRRVAFYSDRQDYSNSGVRVVTRNQRVEASGKLEIAIEQEWGVKTFAVARDRPGDALEHKLSEMVRTLDILVEEAKWASLEEKRRSIVRTERWLEVRAAAVRKVQQRRREAQLANEMEKRVAARAMLEYADELEASTASLASAASPDATRWIEWIRQHALRTDPSNKRPELITVEDAEPSDLEPFMNGWSPHSPHFQGR